MKEILKIFGQFIASALVPFSGVFTLLTIIYVIVHHGEKWYIMLIMGAIFALSILLDKWSHKKTTL